MNDQNPTAQDYNFMTLILGIHIHCHQILRVTGYE